MRQVVALSVISGLALSTALLAPIPAMANPETPAVANPDTAPITNSDAAPEADPVPAAAGPDAGPVTNSVPAVAAPDAPAPSPEQILAETIRATVSDSLRGTVDNAKDLEALRTFYAARNNAPVFVRPDGPTDKMRAAVSRLKTADDDGLNAGDYPTPAIDGTSPEKLVRAELALMSSVLKYARHAQSGRVDPSRISINIAFTPPVPDSLQVLNAVAEATDVATVLNNFNPPHAGFQELRTKLRELRAKPDSATPENAKAVSNKPGGSKVERAKAEHTNPDRTKASTIESVVANMERWRWLPRDLGTAYVVVNIPDYTLTVMRDGQSAFHTRIVVGKKETPSPAFVDEIESVQVNPTWHVPPAVLARNPGMVGRGDFVVSTLR